MSKRLSDYVVRRMTPPSSGQEVVYDSVQPGLTLNLGKAAKTLRSNYQFNGRWQSRSLGRFDQIDPPDRESVIEWARAQVREDKKKAANGIDPKGPAIDSSFAGLVDLFIEMHAKASQRSWSETQRILRTNCRDWLERPLKSIGTADAQRLVDQFIQEGHQAKAQTLLRWLRTLWSFAAKRQLVKDPLAMQSVHLTFKKLRRTDVFSNQDLIAIWSATDKLTSTEAAAIKLLILLAPRRRALANMRWQDLDNPDDPQVWTTPFEHTKSRKNAEPRVYRTPLPKLARRILKRLPRTSPYVFPSSVKDVPLSFGTPLKRKLVRAGAPASFRFHAARHTLASHFEQESDHVVGLLLNHSSGPGTIAVTQGYRHSYALSMKADLLEQWAKHVQGLLSGNASNVERLA